MMKRTPMPVRRTRLCPSIAALFRAFAGVAAVTSFAGLTGCSSIEQVSVGECGNRVLEEDAGEDCDGEIGCAPEGHEHECRYICGADPFLTCPTGWGCGADNVCRKGSSKFDVLQANTTVTARDLLVGDLNRDGCAEAVITAARSTVIEAFASDTISACAASSQTIGTSRPDAETTPLPQPSLAAISEDAPTLALITGTRGLYGDGLSLYFTSGDPTVKPVLFPLLQRPGSSPRTLSLRLLGKPAVLLFEQADGASTTDATLIADPSKAPSTFSAVLPFPIADIASMIAADIEDDAAPEPDRCDEVIVARKSTPHVGLFRLCSGGAQSFAFTPIPVPGLDLDSGAQIRQENQAIVAVDLNGDNHLDLVMNADDEHLHAAYGTGDAHFDAQSPPAMPFGEMTGMLPLPEEQEKELTRADSIFVADEFDAENPGVEFVSLPCPPSDPFRSPTCDEKAGGCEAVVADIDADGDMDIIATEGQELDVAVRRRVADGTFHVSFLRTACPPHQLGVGDVDGDGVADISFFDQTSKGPSQNTTSLSIAYGNALGDPSAPTSSGRFDDAEALSVARFGPSSSGAQLAVARGFSQKSGSALGVVEIGNERAVAAPYYFPSESSGGEPLKQVSLTAQTTGNFNTSEDGAKRAGLAAITKSADNGGVELWLVDDNAAGGSLAAISKSQADDVLCDDACVLLALPTDNGADRLILLGDKVIVSYEVQDGSFTQVDSAKSTRSFRSIIDGSNPAKYAPRPWVGYLDDDKRPDVLARDTTGALIALFGRAGGGFDEQELKPAPTCEGDATCAGYAAATLDVDGDGVEELAIVGPGLFQLYSVVTSGTTRSLVEKTVDIPIPSPSDDADFTALAAEDVDGDGLKDLFMMTSSNFFTVLRTVPGRQ